MRKQEFEKLKKKVADVSDVVDKADYLKNAYWWSGDNGNASARRRREAQLSGSAEWDEGGHHYEASVSVSMSRQHTYVYRDYYKDGIRTNLKAIRYSLARLEAELDAEMEKRKKREASKQARLTAQATAMA